MSKEHDHVRRLILMGTFAAMATVLKAFLSVTTGEFRLTFYDIPLFIGGMILGPAAGLVMGFVVDWMYVLLSPFAFTFNFMTASTMLWGFSAGLIFYKKNFSVKKLIITLVVTSILAFTLNSVQLYIFYGTGMFAMIPVRLLVLIFKWPIQVYVIKTVYDRVLLHANILYSN